MKYLIPLLLFFSVPLRAQSDYEKEENCFKTAHYLQAKPIFENYLKRHPDDLKAIEYLGDIQCHLQNWKAAIPYYQLLTIRNPVNAEYFYKYGGAMSMLAKDSNIFKASSMMDEIKSAFKKALTINPKHIGARWALIEIYIQLPAIFGGSSEKAIRYSDELLKISPVDGYLSKGHIDEYYKQYAQAEKQYRKAIETGNSPTTYQKLADLYKNKMGQPEKAKQVLAICNEKNKL